MAKIDFSQIEGYDAMSDAEKLAALAELDFPDGKDEIEKLKQDAKKSKELIDKYTGEISSLKKASSAGLSEAEAKSKAQEETIEDLQRQLQEIRRTAALETNTAKGVALGCDDELAGAIANAFADSDAEGFYQGLAKYKELIEKQVKADLVKGTPKPDTKGGVKPPKTKEEIMKIKDPSLRQQAIADNIELFEKEN